MHQEDMMFDLKKGSKCNYREVRKFKFFKEDNFEKLVEVMNKFIEGKNAKIVNYTIDGHLNYAKCLLLYSVTIKSKSWLFFWSCWAINQRSQWRTFEFVYRCGADNHIKNS